MLINLTDGELELIAGRARRRVQNDYDTEWAEMVLTLIEMVYDLRQRAQSAELFTHMLKQPQGQTGPK